MDREKQFPSLVETLAVLIFPVRIYPLRNSQSSVHCANPISSGKIRDVGADWGLVDPQTNIFSADTRYNFRTDDGADIFIQTAGPKAPDGHLHLRLVFETGSPKYYWLNNIVGEFQSPVVPILEDIQSGLTFSKLAIGVLTSGLPSENNLKVLRIDAWNVSSPLGG